MNASSCDHVSPASRQHRLDPSHAHATMTELRCARHPASLPPTGTQQRAKPSALVLVLAQAVSMWCRTHAGSRRSDRKAHLAFGGVEDFASPRADARQQRRPFFIRAGDGHAVQAQPFVALGGDRGRSEQAEPGQLTALGLVCARASSTAACLAALLRGRARRRASLLRQPGPRRAPTALPSPPPRSSRPPASWPRSPTGNGRCSASGWTASRNRDLPAPLGRACA